MFKLVVLIVLSRVVTGSSDWNVYLTWQAITLLWAPEGPILGDRPVPESSDDAVRRRALALTQTEFEKSIPARCKHLTR